MRYHSILMLAALLAVAIAPSSAQEGHVLYIGSLDHDEHPDTVVGEPRGDLRMLATAIHWGAPYSSNGAGEPTAQRTMLSYPRWPSLCGSVAVEDLNGDAIDDVILFYNVATPHAGDSSRALALLGQRALHDVPTIDLDAIPRSLQRHPFVALDLNAVGLLGERAMREHSGMPSHRWGSIPIPTADSIRRSVVPPALAEWLALYPNPASDAATFESRTLEPGDYSVDVVDIEGSVHYERRLLIERKQPLKGTLDLSDHPPGLYIVRIHRSGELVASYPIVIVR